MILAVDCGTTNLKAALFDSSLRRVADESVPVEYLTYTPDVVECDAEKIWQSLVTLIRKLGRTAEIQTIAIGSQAQTFTVLDPQGRALIPFIGWPDRRPAAEAKDLVQKLGAEFHQHCSFAPPVAELTVAKILWLRRQQPHLFTDGNVVTQLPSFFALRLAGLNVIDPNLAALCGLYSLKQGMWWDDALRVCGLNPRQLSELVPTGQAVACRQANAELGLNPRVQIVMAGNDQTCGAMGNGVGEGQLLLTLGTALVVYRHAGTKPGPYHTASCWGPFPVGGYYELATRNEGCSALDWAINRLMPGTHPDKFREIAAKAKPGAAFFFPSRMGSDAAWSGRNDVAARARAVIEGISFSVRQLLEEDLDVPRGSVTVRITGGGSRSAWWRQVLADVLRCRVERGGGDALLGAARIASDSVGGGFQDSIDEVAIPDSLFADEYELTYRHWQGLSNSR